MKKIIGTITGLIILFVLLTFMIAYIILNNGSFLTKFEFTNVTNAGLNYYVYFEKVIAAENYDVIVYDNLDNIIYKNNIKDNSTTIEFESLNFNEAYKIVVIAYDENGNKKSIEEPYTFLWDDLTFSKSNLVLMDNNNDYIVSFSGDYKKKDYKLNIKENDILIETVDIKNDEYIIKNKEFKDLPMNYTLEIVDNSIVISTLKLYNLTTPISDIAFTNPANGDMLDYNDVALSFTGGDNATNYLLELYRGNELVRRKEISNKDILYYQIDGKWIYYISE